MFNLVPLQNALIKESSNNDGFLLTNFSHNDIFTDSLLSLDSCSVSTRRWIYIIFPFKQPVKIVHSIEKDILKDLPGDITYTYNTQVDLITLLKEQISSNSIYLLCDSNISVISTVEGGFIDLLRNNGIIIHSAANILRNYYQLNQKMIASHERAASVLYKTVKKTWNFICNHFYTNEPLYELDIQTFIIKQIENAGCISSSAPIVATGKNSSNPHYTPDRKHNTLIKKGDVIQLDLWAKEQFMTDEYGEINSTNTIYADISWVGIYDTSVKKEILEDFNKICEARDLIIEKVKNSLQEKKYVSGASLDILAKNYLINNGYDGLVKHRTGHSIDTECHGSGVNLDAYEFPDYRELCEGSCFSVEPGIYRDEYGLRTEINIYIENGKSYISGRKFADVQNESRFIQTELLLVPFIKGL